MPTVGVFVGVGLSPTAVDARLDLHDSEVMRKKSSIGRTRVSIIAIYPHTMSEATHIMHSPRTAAIPRPRSVSSPIPPGEKFAGPVGEEPTLQATPEARNVLPSSFLHMVGSEYIVLEGNGSHESPAGAHEQL